MQVEDLELQEIQKICHIQYNETMFEWECLVLWNNKQNPKETSWEPLWAVLDGDNQHVLNQAIEIFTIENGTIATNTLLEAIQQYRNFQQWLPQNLNQ